MSDPGVVTDFYGRWAGVYDLIARRTPGIGSMRTAAADALALAPGDTVVEMGCGTGANLPYLRERVGADGRVIGVDLTPEMLVRARRNASRAKWTNVDLLCGDATRPPVAEADAVLATFVVGMLDDPAAAVETWCDSLEPDGRLVLLDATRSDAGWTRVANPLFRGFVALTAPPTTRLRYDESPTTVLDRRVRAAREALIRRGRVTHDDRRAFGFLRLTAGRVE